MAESHHPSHDLVCRPTEPEMCHPCIDDDQDQLYCSTNGFKEEVMCTAGSSKNASSTYITFQSCPSVPSDFMSVVRFEVLMLFLFVASFSFAAKRKNRLRAIQEYRIAAYM
mmetsp:Transcript_67406/g.133592  ORF Transcript_67406/g.133592 Transcript_67406/m.133592 type:complete len:111 (-) Transcript_67406:152-484(-)